MKTTTHHHKSRCVFLDLFFFVALLVVGSIHWNHTTISQVAKDYDTPLSVPSQFHGIWALIIISLFSLVLWEQFGKNKYAKGVQDVGYGIVFAFLYQMIWVPAWNFRVLLLSTLMAVSLWLVLVKTTATARKENCTRTFMFPLSLWTGWVTFGTFMNVSIFFGYYLKCPFFLSTQWAIGAMLIITAFALIWTAVMNEFTYAATIAWGLIGIFCRHHNDATDVVSLICFSILLCALGVSVMLLITTSRVSEESYETEVESQPLVNPPPAPEELPTPMYPPLYSVNVTPPSTAPPPAYPYPPHYIPYEQYKL